MSKQLVAQFTDHLRDTGKSHSTIIAYAKDLEQLVEHAPREVVLMNGKEVGEVLTTLQQKYKFTPKTVSRKLNSFRSFYTYLKNNNHVSSNPAEEVSHPKVIMKPPRVLSQMEYLALREVSRSNPRLHTMIELILQTGLRIGEIARLKIRHVSLNKTGGYLQIEEYSTIPGRKIPLSPKAFGVMKNYIDSVGGLQAEHPLFPTRHGKHIIIRNIRSSIDRAMAKAGIEDACVNDLRNTFIVHQLKSGVPLDLLAEVVGHRSKSTTQKYIYLMTEKYRPNGETRLVDL